MEPDPTFDSPAAERIIRRATELAVSGAGSGNGPLNTEALVEVGREIGLPEPVVRRSIALERLGEQPARSLLDRLVGGRSVVVTADAAAPVDEAMRRADEWLVGGHHLRRDRVTPADGTWSRRSDPIAVAQRTARRLAGDGELAKVRSIRVTAAGVDGTTSMVRIEADRAAARRGTLAGAGAGALVTTGVVATAGVLLSPVLFVAAPVGVVTAGAITAIGRHHERKLAVAVQRLADRVGQGESPRSITGDLGDRLRRRR